MDDERLAVGATLLATVAMLASCHDLLNPELPAGTQDPGTFNNENGAIARYNTAVADAWDAFVQYARTSGTFADELHVAAVPAAGVLGDPFDERILPEISTSSIHSAASDSAARIYGTMQRSRGSDNEAIGALAKFAPDKPTALRSELYAYTAYDEIEMADLFCSGIPLSTLDFEGDFTYKAGVSSVDVYQHAIELLDTASTLGADNRTSSTWPPSAPGRALLALGKYSDAAQAVANVPDDFRFTHLIHWQGTVLEHRRHRAVVRARHRRKRAKGRTGWTSSRATIRDRRRIKRERARRGKRSSRRTPTWASRPSFSRVVSRRA